MEKYRYGKHAVEASLRSGNVAKIFLSFGFKDAPLTTLIQEKKLPVERIEDSQLRKMVDSGLHQGIVALVKPFAYHDLSTLLTKLQGKAQPLLLLLDGVQDPQNFGAIIRTAVGFGVDGLIIKKDRQVDVNATVAKIASGALDLIPIVQVTNLSQTIATLKTQRFWVVATSLKDSQDYRSVDYRSPIALILGSEGDGISPLVLSNSDFRVHIPIQHIESFNVATSAAIMLTTIFQQRHPLK